MSGSAFFEVGEDSRSARIIAALDWVSTPLGPMADWPIALKLTVNLILSSHFPKAIVWGPGLVTLYNDAFHPLLGTKPEAMGRSFADIWAEAWDEIRPIAEKAFAGEATFIEDFPLRINRRGFEEEAFFTFCYSPIRDETGAVVGMMDTVVETTQTVRARQRLEVVNAELAHRMRNLVTMASALASQTLRGGPEVEEKREVLLDRLRALGDVHALLASDKHPSVSIPQLIEAVLEPRMVAADQVRFAGPDVMLSGEAALSLSLALNELLTNAIKYGALSVPTGKVEIAWTIDADDFTCMWREIDGPAVTPPARQGFGTKLIERYVAATVAGEARLVYDPAGMRCEIHGSARALTAAPDRSPIVESRSSA